MRLPLLLICTALTGFAAPPALSFRPDVVVAADGSGNFTTIQAAVDSIPAGNGERRVILVKNGRYREKVRIDAHYVTLRGESREGTRLEFAQGKNDFDQKQDLTGVAVLNINGNDCVIENLTVENTHGVIGTHAFAVRSFGDRTVITDANIFSRGNDTLALPNGENGRYYNARLRIRGSVDFVCPRGWCYMVDTELFEVNPGAMAALWHNGSRHQDQKFVLRNCKVDGVPDWRFARHHVDAQLYFLDCTFSDTMRDLAPKRVTYPTNGGSPSEADLKRNKELDAVNVWGERFYYFNCHRPAGDYAWFADNLHTAAGAPRPEQVTAKWTFAGTWDPESTTGPKIKSLMWDDNIGRVVFTENVTVKGRPRLVLRSGAAATYASGSGSDTLVFVTPLKDSATGATLDPADGAIVATEAAATLRTADLKLPSS